jgi:hypothetical protein
MPEMDICQQSPDIRTPQSKQTLKIYTHHRATKPKKNSHTQSNQTLKKYTHQTNAEEKTNAQAATIIIFFYQTATIPLDKKAPALTVCHMRLAFLVCHMRLAFLVRIYSSHSQLERDRSEDVETGFSGQSIFLPLAP